MMVYLIPPSDRHTQHESGDWSRGTPVSSNDIAGKMRSIDSLEGAAAIRCTQRLQSVFFFWPTGMVG